MAAAVVVVTTATANWKSKTSDQRFRGEFIREFVKTPSSETLYVPARPALTLRDIRKGVSLYFEHELNELLRKVVLMWA